MDTYKGMTLPEGEDRDFPARIDRFWDAQPPKHIRKQCWAGTEFAVPLQLEGWAKTRLQASRYVRAFLYLFNFHVVVLAGLSCVGCWLCSPAVWNIQFKVDTSFLAIGAAFPLSFGINAGFTRREKALTVLASLKASVAALYWIHRDWTVYADFSVDKAQSADSKPQAVAVESLLFEFLVCLKNYLKFDSGYESYAEYVQMKRGGGMFASFGLDLDFNKKANRSMSSVEMRKQVYNTDLSEYWLYEVYKRLSKLSVLNELMGKTVYCKSGEGGLSRLAQYQRYLTADVETIRMLYQYRTPMMLRYGCCVLIHVFALLLAPYFASFCSTWSRNDWNSCPAGYIAAILFVATSMLMYSIQKGLEQPFDMQGLDDCFFDIERELLYVARGKPGIDGAADEWGWNPPGYKVPAAENGDKVLKLEDA